MVYHISTDGLTKEPLDFNDIIEETKYVPLKMAKGYVIGEIVQLLASDDKIMVVTADGVYCYDFEGNPIYKITSKGHARNEFLLCEKITINDSLLYMYDRGKFQTHVYDARTGEFLHNIKCPYASIIYRIGNAFVVEDRFHDFISNVKERFFVYNEDFSKMKYMAFGKEQHFSNLGTPTSLGNECLLYCDYYEGKLYKIMSDKVISYLQIDCNANYRNTPEEIHQAIKSSKCNKENLHGFELVCETDSHIFGQFRLKGTTYQFLFDKNSQHYKIGSYFKTMEKHQVWYYFGTDVPYANNKYMFRAFTPEQISYYQIDNPPLPPTHPDYNNQKIVMKCKPDDNPIIAFYKFKNF